MPKMISILFLSASRNCDGLVGKTCDRVTVNSAVLHAVAISILVRGANISSSLGFDLDNVYAYAWLYIAHTTNRLA